MSRPGATQPVACIPARTRMVKDMPQAERLRARLQDASSLPQTLDVSFDAFEFIRLAARSHEDQVPALFPGFITAAEAAVEGSECVTSAPSLPPPASDPADTIADVPGTGAEQAADALAALAALLAGRLAHAAAAAADPADQAACQDAAGAARTICQLMARAGDDTDPR
jgi:hypothetical protein